jgi:hypothetical protein
MKLRVLGCHGGELPGCRSTCFLVDGSLALDAGALTASLDFPPWPAWTTSSSPTVTSTT